MVAKSSVMMGQRRADPFAVFIRGIVKQAEIRDQHQQYQRQSRIKNSVRQRSGQAAENHKQYRAEVRAGSRQNTRVNKQAVVRKQGIGTMQRKRSEMSAVAKQDFAMIKSSESV